MLASSEILRRVWVSVWVGWTGEIFPNPNTWLVPLFFLMHTHTHTHTHTHIYHIFYDFVISMQFLAILPKTSCLQVDP